MIYLDEAQDTRELSMTSVERVVLIDNFSSTNNENKRNENLHLDESLTKRKRIILMIKILIREIRDRPEILICYFTYFYIRAFNNLSTSFYSAWVGSFYEHTKEGHKDSISTANDILFWSNIVSIPLNIAFGYLSDKVRFRMIYPITTIFIGIGWGLIMIANEPYDLAGFSGEIILLWSTSIHSLMNISLLLKLVGTKIKGPIIAIGIFWGSIGFTASGKFIGFLISQNSTWPFLFGLWYNILN